MERCSDNVSIFISLPFSFTGVSRLLFLSLGIQEKGRELVKGPVTTYSSCLSKELFMSRLSDLNYSISSTCSTTEWLSFYFTSALQRFTIWLTLVAYFSGSFRYSALRIEFAAYSTSGSQRMLSRLSNTADRVRKGDQSSLRIGIMTCPETGSMLRWYILSRKERKGGASGYFSEMMTLTLKTRCEQGELVALVRVGYIRRVADIKAILVDDLDAICKMFASQFLDLFVDEIVIH